MIITIFLLLCICVLVYWISKLKRNKLTFLDVDIKDKKDEVERLKLDIAEKNTDYQEIMEKARTASLSMTADYQSMEAMLIDAMVDAVDRQRESLVRFAESDYRKKCDQLEKDYQAKSTSIEQATQHLQEVYTQRSTAYTAQLNELRATIDSANKAIRAQRALNEQQDFYRICLPDETRSDIMLLKSITPNLHFREKIDKMIYDNYVAKPTLEMIKRVLEGKSPSGIYKITRIKTGEVYIGKSTDVKARWQQHIKTAFNCGTIAHSIFHTTLEKDGVDQFTFELLEEVPKDKLGEREKFWIDFYGSKQYGLNEKAGG